MAQSRIERMVEEVRIHSYWKVALLTIAAAAAAVIISVTSFTSVESTAHEAAAPQVVDSDTTYFPSQYLNKAIGPSDHIQGF